MLRTFTSFPMNSAFIQIVDDVIGMMFWTEVDGGRIAIWSWKTGKILVVSTCQWLYHTKLLTAYTDFVGPWCRPLAPKYQRLFFHF